MSEEQCPDEWAFETLGRVQCSLLAGHLSEHRHFRGNVTYTWPNYAATKPGIDPSLERIAEALERLVEIMDVKSAADFWPEVHWTTLRVGQRVYDHYYGVIRTVEAIETTGENGSIRYTDGQIEQKGLWTAYVKREPAKP